MQAGEGVLNSRTRSRARAHTSCTTQNSQPDACSPRIPTSAHRNCASSGVASTACRRGAVLSHRGI
eukprot:6209519-Pleurochrysis_carterae.AAC.4